MGKLLENANEEAALSSPNSSLWTQTSTTMAGEESPVSAVLQKDSAQLLAPSGSASAADPALPRLTHPIAHCGEDKSGLFHLVGVTLMGKHSLRGWPSFGEVPKATPPQPSLAFLPSSPLLSTVVHCSPRRMSCSRSQEGGHAVQGGRCSQQAVSPCRLFQICRVSQRSRPSWSSLCSGAEQQGYRGSPPQKLLHITLL